ncbi:y4mF family transcriptional regulator (plasmid) [Ensifer sp. WSM1721]|uniref:helix-turn-helix transcriptional regulator n=1 Tax=Ensifer sp. WSM1721 TaxID=1041159 RepID=UPI0004B3EE13|nr:helix-turn-helix transcriptional regulator [Ensifer sp. WSM1721]
MSDQSDKIPSLKKATDVARLLAQSPLSEALRDQVKLADLHAGTKALRDISAMSKSLTDTLKSVDIPSVRLATEALKSATAFKLPSVEMPNLGVETQHFGLPKPLSPVPHEQEPYRTKAKADDRRHHAAEIVSTADLGHIVRKAREERKLSQQEFADLAGVGRRFISELENGKATLEFQKVLKVAHAAGISIFAEPR